MARLAHIDALYLPVHVYSVRVFSSYHSRKKKCVHEYGMQCEMSGRYTCVIQLPSSSVRISSNNNNSSNVGSRHDNAQSDDNSDDVNGGGVVGDAHRQGRHYAFHYQGCVPVSLTLSLPFLMPLLFDLISSLCVFIQVSAVHG